MFDITDMSIYNMVIIFLSVLRYISLIIGVLMCNMLAIFYIVLTYVFKSLICFIDKFNKLFKFLYYIK